MSDCAYCKSNNFTLPIAKYELDFGTLGVGEVMAYIANYDEGAFIDFQFSNYGLHAKTLKKRSVQIQYCPQCGRRLSD